MRTSHALFVTLLAACGPAQVELARPRDASAREERLFTPAYDSPRVVEPGQRWFMGGLRIERRGGVYRLADQPLPASIVCAVEVASGWVFLAEDDTAWRADTFVGALTSLGSAPASSNGTKSEGVLLVIGTDQRLYWTDGTAPLAAFAALEDYGVTIAHFESATRGRVREVGGKVLETRDGGRTFEDTRESWPEARWAERHPAELEVTGDLLAVAVTRYPGLEVVVPGLERFGEVLAWGDVGLIVDGAYEAVAEAGEDCIAMGGMVSWCDGSVRVHPLGPGEWSTLLHTLVPPGVMASADGASLLIDPRDDAWELLCWVERESGERIDIARALLSTEHEIVALREKELLVNDWRGNLIRIHAETRAQTRHVVFESHEVVPMRHEADGSITGEDLLTMRLLPDGSVLALASRPHSHGSHAPRLARIVHEDGNVVPLALPEGAESVAMLSPMFGVATDLEERAFLTRDGGAHWRPLSYRGRALGAACGSGACVVGATVVAPGRPADGLGRLRPDMRVPGQVFDCRSEPSPASWIAMGSLRVYGWPTEPGRFEFSWSFGERARQRAVGTVQQQSGETEQLLGGGVSEPDQRTRLVGGSANILLGRHRDVDSAFVAANGVVRALPLQDVDFAVPLPDGGLGVVLERSVDDPGGVVRLDVHGAPGPVLPVEGQGIAVTASGQLGVLRVSEQSPFTAGNTERFVVVEDGGRRYARTLDLAEIGVCQAADEDADTWWLDSPWLFQLEGFERGEENSLRRAGRVALEVTEAHGCIRRFIGENPRTASDSVALEAHPDGHIRGRLHGDEVDCHLR